MGFFKVVGIAAIPLFGLLSVLGGRINESIPPESPPVDDAKAAIRMKLQAPEISEVHYLASAGVVCGLVNHAKSEVGRAPFAYSHKLGLSVAPVWGRNEPQKLNKLYGCSFLPVAYVDEWTSPFWESEQGDAYWPEPEVL